MLDAFAAFDLTPRTGHLSHRLEGIASIDHLAVPEHWRTTEARMTMPTSDERKPLSDHAAYIVEVAPV